MTGAILRVQNASISVMEQDVDTSIQACVVLSVTAALERDVHVQVAQTLSTASMNHTYTFCQTHFYPDLSINVGSMDVGSEPLPNITFAVGSVDESIQCVTVVIVGDEIVENSEMFSLQFMAVHEQDEFTAPNTAVITILDDDS